MPQHPQARLAPRHVGQHLRRGVATGVVDIDDLVLDPAVERALDLVDQRRDVLRFVVDRDNDRQCRLWGRNADHDSDFERRQERYHALPTGP